MATRMMPIHLFQAFGCFGSLAWRPPDGGLVEPFGFDGSAGDMRAVSAWITVLGAEEKSETGASDGRVIVGSWVVVEDDAFVLAFALALVAALVLAGLDGESFCSEILWL